VAAIEQLTPLWFKQRQCRAEQAGEDLLKVSGPNLPEAYLHIGPGENGTWKAGLRYTPEGPDVVTALAEQPNARAAWDAAFELYRTHVIV
jgi:hypothetical protein